MKYTDNIYGDVEISGVVEAIINTRVFQRLKKIHQGGAIVLVDSTVNHTRFDHSIGVMLLIQKLGGSIEEQIAGLLHDISHTASSHLIDYVFENEEEDYHEKRYGEVLKDQELNEVLERYAFESSDFLKLEAHQILEYSLPSLCADRIDYTLRDLFQIGEVSRKEVDWFLSGLKIFKKRIVLTSEEHGKWFKSKYDFLVSDYFGEKENVEVNIIMKKIIKDCLEKGIIEEKDFFEDDFFLIEKMNNSIELQTQITNYRKQGLENGKLKSKKRMVDPEILINGSLMKLSKIS